jgi:ornithine cyclodeaminase
MMPVHASQGAFMRIFSPQDTAAALPFPALIDAIHAAFAAGTRAPLRHHHTIPKADDPDQTLLLMPCWDDVIGAVKIATVTPGAATRGKPAVTASVLAFDARDGTHLALLDGATLTARRTAAAAALGAKLLARPDARRLLVCGAGAVGSLAPDAFRAALPGLNAVAVWNKSAPRRDALVARLRAEGWDAAPAPDLQAAVAAADVITCATLSTAPILKGAWLRPGQHVDLIGAFTPLMREVDDEALIRADVFVDTEAALTEAGEIVQGLASGALARASIGGTFYDLCVGPRRVRGADDITLFKGVGTAVEDHAAVRAALMASGMG